jgi:hypothetical protein
LFADTIQPAIVAPQSVTIENVSLTPAFINTHLISIDPSNPSHFVSTNGLRGVISDKRDMIYIVEAPPANDDAIEFLRDPASSFKKKWSFDSQSTQRLFLLRETEVQLPYFPKALPLILISDPITYPGCTWSSSHRKESIASIDRSSLALHKDAASAPEELTLMELKKAAAPVTVSDILNPAVVPEANSTNETVAGVPESPGQSKEDPASADPSRAPLFPEAPVAVHLAPKGMKPLHFHEFVNKLRQREASEILRQLKVFIADFTKLTSQIGTSISTLQENAVREFLLSMNEVVRLHPLWKSATDEELENDLESLEKLLMLKIHSAAFSCDPSDDETDRLIYRRIKKLIHLKPINMEIPPEFEMPDVWSRAGEELLRINSYKVPRDKLICVINTCKIILAGIAQKKASVADAPGADDFLPHMIYVVLQCNPPKLVSNIRFIERFRPQNKLLSEAGYYFITLMSCISFIENCDAKAVNLSEQEFQDMMAEQPSISLALFDAATPDIVENELAPPEEKSMELEDVSSGVELTESSVNENEPANQGQVVSPPNEEEEAKEKEKEKVEDKIGEGNDQEGKDTLVPVELKGESSNLPVTEASLLDVSDSSHIPAPSLQPMVPTSPDDTFFSPIPQPSQGNPIGGKKDVTEVDIELEGDDEQDATELPDVPHAEEFVPFAFGANPSSLSQPALLRTLSPVPPADVRELEKLRQQMEVVVSGMSQCVQRAQSEWQDLDPMDATLGDLVQSFTAHQASVVELQRLLNLLKPTQSSPPSENKRSSS